MGTIYKAELRRQSTRMKLLIFFTFIGVRMINTLDSEEQTCSPSHECLNIEKCPYWSKVQKKIRGLINGSSEKTRLVNKIRSSVCNKKAKGVCCPPWELVEPKYRQCVSSEVCTTRESCPHWERKYKKLNSLPRNSNEYTKILKDMKSAVCNRKQRGLCCPNDFENINDSPLYLPVSGAENINDSPNYLPVAEAGECGLSGNAANVFGGTSTKPGEYPFAALLGRTVLRDPQVIIKGKRQPKIEQPSWVCGGTLINYWYVVTAAHCIGKGIKRITHLRLGEWNVGGFGSGNKIECDSNGVCLPKVQDFRISEDDIKVHKDYKKKFRNIENDIALIRLPQKPTLNSGVQFACLPVPESAYSAGIRNWNSGVSGKNAVVIGWGYSCYENNTREFCKDEHIGNKQQQKLEVPVLTNQKCEAASLTTTEDQVCAGGEKGKGSCKGDSGGGLFYRRTSFEVTDQEARPWFLFGIVSYGNPICGIEKPEVYTKVSQYVNWIKKNIN